MPMMANLLTLIRIRKLVAPGSRQCIPFRYILLLSGLGSTTASAKRPYIYIYIYVWMRLDGHVVYTCICYVYMGCMICRSMCFILEKGSFRVKHWIRKMSSGCDDPERSTTRIARWLQGIRIQREIHRLGMTAVETCWNYNHAADVSKS